MKYTSTVTSKGTITLPAVYRKKLGLRQGQKIDIDLKNETLTITKTSDIKDIRAQNAKILQKNGITRPPTQTEIKKAIEEGWLERFKRYQNQ